PLMHDKIREFTPADIRILSQGEIVADSLADYLSRHSEIEKKLSLGGGHHFYTTDSTEDFDKHAANFYGAEIRSVHVDLENQKL
ncbi:MAG TPA: glutamate racemase, partial [Chitinophagaceae bacterium]|nr:glutamate racemase [Chitinophagaceae bacterium]